MSPSRTLESPGGRTQRYFTALVGAAGLALAACAGAAPSQAGTLAPPPAEPPATTPTQPASPDLPSPPPLLEDTAVAEALADPAVLPAVSVPTRGPVAHSVVAGGDAALCEVSSCVPPGVYQQQPATGDWCAWTYSPAGEDPDVTVRSWKDADGQEVTLNEGDLLSYGPSDGAIEFSEGVEVPGAGPGDGVPRGCAEWVRVDRPEATTTLGPTVEECRGVVDAGERAVAALESLSRELFETIERFQVLSQAPPAELAEVTVADLFEVVETAGDHLGAYRAEVLEADPKMRNAAACHHALGNTEASDGFIHNASLNRVTFADFGYLLDLLRETCLEEYAPFGFDCSRL